MANKNIKKKRTNQKNSKPSLNNKNNTKYLLFLGFAVFLTAIVFSNILNGKFLTWDDNLLVPENPDIKAINIENLKKIFSSYYIGMYQPLTTLFYAVIYHFFNDNPYYFHLASYLFHILNVALVFLLIFKISQRVEIAALVAVFFGIHPMHVESVAWIAEFKDVLYGCFFIASLLLYAKYIKSNKPSLYFLSISLFLCSLFSKSAAVTLPPVLILFDYYFNRKLLDKKIIIEKIPFFILSLIFGIIALKTQAGEKAIVDITPLFSLIDRFFLVSYSASFYIVKFFIPLNLSTLHYYPINSGKFFPLEYYLAPAFILLIIMLVIFYKKYRQLLIFGLLFYLINISLVLQIIPVGQAIVAERYTYIPYIGLLFIIGKIYADIIDNKFKNAPAIKPFFNAILIIAIFVFSYASFQRNKVWKDTVVLFTDVINKNPDIFYSYTVRGGALINDKKYREGIIDYETSIKLQPNYYDPYFNIGKAYYFLGDLNKAISYYDKALQLKPDFAEAYNNRAAALFGLQQYHKTIIDCNKAISLKPDYADAYVNRGNAKGMLKDYFGSIQDFNRGLQLDPTLREAYMNRGLSKIYINNISEGCSDFKTALNLGDSAAISLINKYCN